MRDRAKEAFLITATVFVLGLVGLILNDGVGRWVSGTGLLGLGATFAIVYAGILLWLIWFYRGR
jgi:hypothetical protein